MLFFVLFFLCVFLLGMAYGRAQMRVQTRIRVWERYNSVKPLLYQDDSRYIAGFQEGMRWVVDDMYGYRVRIEKTIHHR